MVTRMCELISFHPALRVWALAASVPRGQVRRRLGCLLLTDVLGLRFAGENSGFGPRRAAGVSEENIERTRRSLQQAGTCGCTRAPLTGFGSG